MMMMINKQTFENIPRKTLYIAAGIGVAVLITLGLGIYILWPRTPEIVKINRGQESIDIVFRNNNFLYSAKVESCEISLTFPADTSPTVLSASSPPTIGSREEATVALKIGKVGESSPEKLQQVCKDGGKDAKTTEKFLCKFSVIGITKSIEKETSLPFTCSSLGGGAPSSPQGGGGSPPTFPGFP